MPKKVSLFESSQEFQWSEANENSSIVKNAVYTGKYQYGFDEMEISLETVSDFKKNFGKKVMGIAPAVNYNHEIYGKAAGWINSVEVREFESAMLDDKPAKDSKKRYSVDLGIEWTPAAAQAIRDGEYKYFSVEFSNDFKNSETGMKTKNVLTGGALTNKPFLKSTVVELEDGEHEEKEQTLNYKEIQTVLLSDHNVNLEDLIAKSKKLSEVEAELEKAEDKIEALEGEIKEAAEEATEKEVAAILHEAMKSGKTSKFLCDSVLKKHFLSIGAVEAKKIVDQMPVSVKIEPAGASLSDDVPEGESVDEKRDRMALAEMDKSKVSYEEALKTIDSVLFGGKK